MGVCTTEDKKGPGSVQHVVELFNYPPEALKLSDEERKTLSKKLIKSSAPGGFAPDSLTASSPISFFQELGLMVIMGVCIGGPLVAFFLGVFIMVVGSWTANAIFFTVLAVLVLHPLPQNWDEWLCKTPLTLWMYKYFSYRIMWSGDAMDLADATPVWVGMAGPHGVLPFANILSMPAIRIALCRRFVGAAASAVFRAPLLRYLTLFGCVDVSGASMAGALKDGCCVGMNPDGIAGIFKCSHDEEVLFLKERKGLAKFCIRNGTTVVPAYSIGNSECFHLWFDPFGIMEYLSRKLQASLFIYWGRLYLPIPRRVNVTLLIGTPIPVEQKSEQDITSQDVDDLHNRMLASLEKVFEEHKAALGWGHKKMYFV